MKVMGLVWRRVVALVALLAFAVALVPAVAVPQWAGAEPAVEVTWVGYLGRYEIDLRVQPLKPNKPLTTIAGTHTVSAETEGTVTTVLKLVVTDNWYEGGSSTPATGNATPSTLYTYRAQASLIRETTPEGGSTTTETVDTSTADVASYAVLWNTASEQTTATATGVTFEGRYTVPEPNTVITAVDEDLSALKPVPGGGATGLEGVSAKPYGVASDDWKDETGNMVEAEDNPFQQGKTYTYVARLEPKDGYEFDTEGSGTAINVTGDSWVDPGTLSTYYDTQGNLIVYLEYTVPVYDLGLYTFDMTLGAHELPAATAEELATAQRVLNELDDFTAVGAIGLDAFNRRIDVNADGVYDIGYQIGGSAATFTPLEGRSNLLEYTVEMPATKTSDYLASEALYYSAFAFQFPLRSDLAALKEALQSAALLAETDYVPATWAPFAQAKQQAQAALDALTVTQQEVADAAAQLAEAQDALVLNSEYEAARVALAQALDAAPLPADEGDYTPASIQALKDAQSAAKALLEDSEATTEQLEQAQAEVEAAFANLAFATPDMTELSQAIAAAKALDEAGYTPTSWAPFAQELAAAEALAADPGARNSGVQAAAAALRTAQDALVERADSKELADAVDAALNYAEGDYTPESWAPFAQALADAQAVLANGDATQAQTDAALGALRDASSGLVTKAFADAVKALADALETARTLAEGSSSPKVAAFLDAVINAAQQVLDNPNATQGEVDAALDSLATAQDLLEEPAETTTTTTEAKRPGRVKLKSAKAGKRRAVVTWKKLSDSVKYQVAYRVKGAKKWKKKAAGKKASLTIKKLKAGKKYQFKVRAFKKADGKKLYSKKWSKVKACKVK